MPSFQRRQSSASICGGMRVSVIPPAPCCLRGFGEITRAKGLVADRQQVLLFNCGRDGLTGNTSVSWVPYPLKLPLSTVFNTCFAETQTGSRGVVSVRSARKVPATGSWHCEGKESSGRGAEPQNAGESQACTTR